MTRTHDQFEQDVIKRNKLNPSFGIRIKPGSEYRGLDKEMMFECCNGHPDFITRPRYVIHKGSGCPLCGSIKIGNTNSKGMDQFKKELSQLVNGIKLISNQQYVNGDSKLEFICPKRHRFFTSPKSIISGSGCPTCANVNRRQKLIKSVVYGNDQSGIIQAEVDQLTKGLNINVVIISIAIPLDRMFVLDQARRAKNQTLFIFEDEWLNNRDLVVSKIKHYANNSNLISIHARKCIIKQITNADKRELLDNNHIQGNDNAQISYGAYFEDKLIAVMTFARPRVAVGAKRNREDYVGIWELSRFCTDVNYRIPGIASKLLTYFKRNNEWTEIYSFADKRWSVGNMYIQLGFELVANNPPAYFYVVDGVRKHRWNYRKDALKTKLPRYDSSLTEHQNMKNHGYYRVWDCGTLKFSMVNTNGSKKDT